MKRIRQVATVFLLMVLTAASAWADTEVRPATQFEKDYMLRVLTGFDNALPQQPADWTETDRTGVKAPKHMAVGAAWGPMPVHYRVKWENRAAKAEASRRMEEASRSIEMPDEAVMDEISREMDKLTEAMTLAAQSGDMQAMQRLQKEAEKLSAKSQAAFAATDAQIRQIEQSAPKDADVEIAFAANEFGKTLYGPVRQAPVAGLTVYRVEEKDASADPGASYVFLGEWEDREEVEHTTFQAEPRADRIPASVQTIVVTVRAEDRLARRTLEGIDWKALRSLISE